MAKKDNKTIFIAIAIVLAALIIGPYLQFSSVTYVTNEITDLLNNPPLQAPGSTCSLGFDRTLITQGQSVSGTLRDGISTQCTVYYKFTPLPESIHPATNWAVDSIVTTDKFGTYTETRIPEWVGIYTLAVICNDCVTEQKSITVKQPAIPLRCIDSDGDDMFTFGWTDDTELSISYPDACLDGDTVIEQLCTLDDGFISGLRDCPVTYKCEGGRCVEQEGYNLGDVVGGSTGSGALVGGGADFTFDLSGVETGGPCRLGARIQTTWDYVDAQACFGMIAMEGIEWNFYDSEYAKWHVDDLSPQSHDITLCPLVWDGETNWKLEMLKIWNVPGCQIDYDYSVSIYVCECD